MMLERDASEDMDTAKAVLETLNLLCEVEESEIKVGQKHQTCRCTCAHESYIPRNAKSVLACATPTAFYRSNLHYMPC